MALVKDVDKSVQGLSRAGGTLEYMAPEQAIGCASDQSDLYSLAKVIIEMITGSRLVNLLPDAGLDLSQRVRKLFSVGDFGLSPPTIEILASALEFHPAHRLHDVRLLAESIANDLESSPPSTINSPSATDVRL
jgi:serine/threonine protein kinase